MAHGRAGHAVRVVFWYPEVRQDNVFIILIFRWKHQNQCGDICGGGQIQATVTHAPLKVILGGGKGTFVPSVHWHPTDCLLDPLVQTKLPEGILFTRVLLGGLTGITHFVDAHRNTQGGVCLLPGFWVSPVIAFIRTVDNGIESVVDFATFDDILGFLVDLITDGFGIVACRGNKEVQWLHTSITGALGHNIKQLSVRLRVQFIENNSVGVEAVLVADISRKYLVDASRG